MFSRQTSRLFLITLMLLLSGMACNVATNLIQPDRIPSPAISTEGTEISACPSVLSSIVQAGTTTESYEPPAEESLLVTYPVQGDDLGTPYYEAVSSDLSDKQANTSAQKDIWSYFARLIPEHSRTFLTESSFLTNGKNNLLAAVAQSHSDPAHWRLEVDIADAKDYENLTFTLIHEYGHLLTLNKDQVAPSMAVFNSPHDPAVLSHEAAMCANFFPNEGCSKHDSYINRFYQRFWSDKFSEWYEVETIQDEYLYYMRLNEFYEKYQDQFVTEYAAANPGEDIAETWAYFVLAPKSRGSTIADQKVLFFYEYPELVQLRQKIMKNLCDAFPQ